MIEGLFQPTHLIVILIVVLIVFGPGRLPEIGGAVGKAMREFRQYSSGVIEQASQAASSETHTATDRVTCPTCHTENPKANGFCGQCGAKLG